MIAIIDSGGANIASVQFALERLGTKGVLTDDAETIDRAEKVILPGVGAAPTAMDILSRSGLVACIRALKQPVLGICLGMELLFERSDEGDVELLGLIEGECVAIDPAQGLSVPHMGWNSLRPTRTGAAHPLLKGVDAGAHVYFVHGYAVPAGVDTIASYSYGSEYAGLAGRANFMGGAVPPRTLRGGWRHHSWRTSLACQAISPWRGRPNPQGRARDHLSCNRRHGRRGGSP